MFSNISQTQHEVLHSVSHSAFNIFNIFNIMMGIGYIMECWPHIIRIIYIFLKLHLPECIQPKQTLAPPPLNTLHSPNSLNHPQFLYCCQEPASLFFMTANSNLIHSPLWFLPKASNHFVMSRQQPAINASCRQ